MSDIGLGAAAPGETGGVKTCPYCLERIRAEAVRCRHCRTWLLDNPLQHEWYRSSEGKLAGVCQGLADQFRVSASLLRVLFVLLTIFGAGTGLIIYVALWFIMPLAPPRTRGE